MKLTKTKARFKVPFSFDVFFGRGLVYDSDFLTSIFTLTPETKILFFIEDSIAILFPDLAQKIFETFEPVYKKNAIIPPVIFPGGEKNKKIENVIELCKIISLNGLCRHSYLAAIGGGAFLDTVCFAASISHRGIRQARFPTTVVSQSDSGIGVKNAVNLFGKKNFAGTFTPPNLVVNDFIFIDTLSRREKVAGAAEAIKVAIIKDKQFFSFLERNSEKIRNGDTKFYEVLIKKSAILHLKHITKSGDPFEFGSARPLDFGHWLAHKLETMSNGRIRHGEAVSIGIAADSYLAMKMGFISLEEFNRIINLIKQCSLPLWNKLLDKKTNGINEALKGISEFREHLGGKLSITLPKSIGSKIEIDSINENYVIEAFQYLCGISQEK